MRIESSYIERLRDPRRRKYAREFQPDDGGADDRPEDLDPEDMPGFNPDWQDPEATPDESMDGDHASALESVYGPND